VVGIVGAVADPPQDNFWGTDEWAVSALIPDRPTVGTDVLVVRKGFFMTSPVPLKIAAW